MNEGRMLDAAERLILADTLGETPQTTMSGHRLRRGLARAAVAGSLERPEAAIVQAFALMSEPAGFGDDPERIWEVLRGLDGWTSIHVALPVGPPLAALIEADTGMAYRLEEEIYFQADAAGRDGAAGGAGGANPDDTPGAAGLPRGPLTPPEALAVPEVRRLGMADVRLMEAATDALGMAGWRFGSAAAQIADGFAAGAEVEGRLAAVAFTASRSARFGEVGIVTEAAHRGRGYAGAAAALVAADLRTAGLTVIWSTSVENTASRRIAAKLGLGEVSRRVYLYPAAAR